MSHEARSARSVDAFADARRKFEEMVAWASGAACPEHHADLEAEIDERGREVQRLVLQARVDRLFDEEHRWLRKHRPPGKIRVRKRSLETVFGRVVVRRHDVKLAGSKRYRLDDRLGLPTELYSLGLRRRVAEETRAQSWDQSLSRLKATTAGHVPKRQAEELVARAAQDFDAFQAQRKHADVANDADDPQTLLVLSCDGKGITMRPEALRDATRKQAETGAQKGEPRGDPTEVRVRRRHTKRMATVTAVWDQTPCPRTASDIARKLGGEKESKAKQLPRPRNKRLNVSVEKSLAEGVAEMFDEADRRDPGRARPTVVLVDGNEQQRAAIEAESARRNRPVTLVLDLLHVLHYVWVAGMAVRRGDAKKAEDWVAHYLKMLLTAKTPLDVIAGIKIAATHARLTAKERTPVDRCEQYLAANMTAIAYPDFLTRGLPIATGVIEGACRHLVQDRLGITGARWGLDSAEAVLRLRSLHASGQWAEYWRFHLRCERERALIKTQRAA